MAVAAVALSACSSSSAKDRSYEARSACQDWVKDKLKAPASAEFGGHSVDGGEQGPWTITGWVDAQNSFGAKLRNTWTCTVRLDGSTLKGSAKLT